MLGVERDVTNDRHSLVRFPGPKPEVTCPHVTRVQRHVSSKCDANPNIWHIKMPATINHGLEDNGHGPRPEFLDIGVMNFDKL